MAKEFSYSFVAPRLRDLDSMPGELLVVSLFEDERPPRGLAGLVDWRMDGLVSRMRAVTINPDLPNPHFKSMVLGTFGAAGDEKLLFPPGHRLPYFRVMTVGLGQTRRFDSHRYKAAVRTILLAASSMHVAQMTLQLPGWQVAGLPARRAADVFITELIAVRQAGGHPPTSVCLVEALDHQAEMDEKLCEVLGRGGRR